MVPSKTAKVPAKLAQCNSEEEVKSEFAKAFKLKLDTRSRMDLYTPQILFEFKFKRNLQVLTSRAAIVAQMLYYIRRLKIGNSKLTVPRLLCAVDHNQAFILDTKTFKHVYGSTNAKFDWDRAPSTPCPNIVMACREVSELANANVYGFASPVEWENFESLLSRNLSTDLELDFSGIEKKTVSEDNFESAFELWSGRFSGYIKDDRKLSEYFLADLREGASVFLRERGEVAFDLGNGALIKKPVPIRDYENFWATYDRVSDPGVLRSIRQRVDRLSVEDFRRFTGEFYTPIEFAHKGMEYLERTIGPRWWENGYRLWDMAAGTGNLLYDLPAEALPHCYVSTLLEDDADYCSRLFPESTVFQYDYLNDDVAILHGGGLDFEAAGISPKLPARLVEELRNPELKWIIFINPPFATSNVGARDSDVSKDSVSMTQVRRQMGSENLLETSRELFSQFLWRISKDFAGKDAVLGMFSKLKYLNAPNDQKMRDGFFSYKFETGFCFPARAFHGNKGNFAVGFLIWNLSLEQKLNEQQIWLDIFNSEVEKIGTKHFSTNDRTEALSSWVDRPPTKKILPPLSNGITVGEDRVDVRDKVAEDFLCSLMAAGNDFSQQNKTALFSGPYVSAGAISVTPENFDKAMVWHTVRRLPKATWLNDKDQWFRPTKPLADDFITNCAVWTAFSKSNETASLANLKYQNQTFNLQNNLFPFKREEIKNWACSLTSIQDELQLGGDDRYFASWLSRRALSEQAQRVLQAGEEVYKYFYANLSNLPWPLVKVKNWDAGWYQIRRALTLAEQGDALLLTLQQAHNDLGDSLFLDIEELGFLQAPEKFFADEVTLDLE